MCSLAEICFLCTRNHNCIVVDDEILTKVKFVLPEITLIKLGISLQICTICEKELNSFNEFKHACVETSFRLEATLTNTTAHACATQNTEDNNAVVLYDLKPENEFYFKEELLAETSLVVDSSQYSVEKTTDDITISEEEEEDSISIKEENLIQKFPFYDHNFYNSLLETLVKDETLKNETENIKFVEESTDISETLLVKMDENAQPKCTTNKNKEVMDPKINKSDKKSCKLKVLRDKKGKFIMRNNNNAKITTKNTKKVQRKKINCSFCNKIYSCSLKLKEHTIKNHLQCRICNKTFASKWNVKRHYKIHKHVCYICNKKLAHDFSLQRHLKIHSEG